MAACDLRPVKNAEGTISGWSIGDLPAVISRAELKSARLWGRGRGARRRRQAFVDEVNRRLSDGD